MTMIATNTTLQGIATESRTEFKPSEILAAFGEQLTRRQRFHDQKEFFLPRPSLEDAKLIVKKSNELIATIIEKRRLDPDMEVIAVEAKKDLVEAVRTHLKEFAY